MAVRLTLPPSTKKSLSNRCRPWTSSQQSKTSLSCSTMLIARHRIASQKPNSCTPLATSLLKLELVVWSSTWPKALSRSRKMWATSSWYSEWCDQLLMEFKARNWPSINWPRLSTSMEQATWLEQSLTQFAINSSKTSLSSTSASSLASLMTAIMAACLVKSSYASALRFWTRTSVVVSLHTSKCSQWSKRLLTSCLLTATASSIKLQMRIRSFCSMKKLKNLHNITVMAKELLESKKLLQKPKSQLLKKNRKNFWDLEAWASQYSLNCSWKTECF